MTSFYGGLPPTSFSNDELYRLGQAINGATAPVVVTPPPPPPPSPSTGPVSCPGFDNTIYVDLPWGTTSRDGSTPYPRLITNSFTGSDVLVIKLNPPAGVVSSLPGSIGLAEWGGGNFTRYAIISLTPCDFTLSALTYNYKIASNVFYSLQVGGTQQPGIFRMQPGVPYYLTLKNQNQYGTQTCPAGVSCNLSIDFVRPPGT